VDAKASNYDADLLDLQDFIDSLSFHYCILRIAIATKVMRNYLKDTRAM